MDNRFNGTFGDGGGYVCEGDSITAEVEGFTVTATLLSDPDSSPAELDAPGCCFDTSDPEHGERNEKIIEAWRNDEWFYFTVALSVAKNGITLDEYAASLGGVEGNFPRPDDDLDNSHLTDTANELLDEALGAGKEALAGLIAA